MVKVLQITVRADFGGGPEHLFQLLSHVTRDVKVFIACPRDFPYYERYQRLTRSNDIFEIAHREFRVRKLFSIAFEIRRRGIELIHSHGKGAGLYGRLLAVLTGRPCIHTFHGLHVSQYGPVKRAIYLAYERTVSLATAAAVCVSEGEKCEVRRAGIMPTSKIHVIENGVGLPKISAADVADGVFRIIAVNRYDVQKNPELIVLIARHLAESSTFGRFELRVLGAGDGLERCRALASEIGLQDCLILSGPTSNPREWFRKADVFLSTSRWEGMPLAVLEAMSEGLPVVATDVVGNRDVVENNVSGVLYPSGDADAAAAILHKLRMDDDLRARMGRSAHESVGRRFNASVMAERTVELYHKIINKN